MIESDKPMELLFHDINEKYYSANEKFCSELSKKFYTPDPFI